MNTAAIIQARMTSTRLPGKVLMPVLGRPLLAYLAGSLRRCGGLDGIILATTVNREDDPVAAWAEQEGLACYRGSENDVLDRFYQGAKAHGLAQVMRVTGDCPLLQPGVCAKVLEAHLQSGADYTTTGETFADGLDCEVFRFEALERSWREAVLPSEREHVTLYISSHPESFRTRVVESDTDDRDLRLTVDEAADFEVVRQVLEALYDPAVGYVPLDAIKAFLRQRPEVRALNRRIERNEGLRRSLDEDLHAGADAGGE